MKKFLMLTVLTLATSMIAQQANASTLVRVSQESSIGAGDFDNNILGFIDPFNTTKTAKNYYKYEDASFNGPAPTLVKDQSHLFLVDAADGLSLFVVHNKPHPGFSNEEHGSANMRFDLSGDTADLKLVDDDISDKAERSDGGTTFTSKHNWNRFRTDGLVIGSLDNDWEMLVQFTAASTGLTSWLADSSSGASVPLEIETGRRVRLDFAPSPPISVPEPSSILGLLAFGTFGVSSLLKHKQQQKVLN